MTDNTLITVPQTCVALNVCRGTVYKLFKSGALTPVKLGRATRVRAADVARLAQTGAA